MGVAGWRLTWRSRVRADGVERGLQSRRGSAPSIQPASGRRTAAAAARTSSYDGRRRRSVATACSASDAASATTAPRQAPAAGALFVDCSTIGPQATAWSAASSPARGLRCSTRRSTGSSPRAEDGTLTIMVGGERRGTSQPRQSRCSTRWGRRSSTPGRSARPMVKLINNAGGRDKRGQLGQALVVGARAASTSRRSTQLMRAGSGASTMLDLKAAADARARLHDAVQARPHAQGRPLCLEEGEALGAPFPFAALTREILAGRRGTRIRRCTTSPR